MMPLAAAIPRRGQFHDARLVATFLAHFLQRVLGRRQVHIRPAAGQRPAALVGRFAHEQQPAGSIEHRGRVLQAIERLDEVEPVSTPSDLRLDARPHGRIDHSYQRQFPTSEATRGVSAMPEVEAGDRQRVLAGQVHHRGYRVVCIVRERELIVVRALQILAVLIAPELRQGAWPEAHGAREDHLPAGQRGWKDLRILR